MVASPKHARPEVRGIIHQIRKKTHVLHKCLRRTPLKIPLRNNDIYTLTMDNHHYEELNDKVFINMDQGDGKMNGNYEEVKEKETTV